MARLGVTFNEVAEAASQLVGQGKNPTIEQVRLILGTGSSTTIANHLRQWKEAETKTCLLAVKENIPEELIAFLKGLWERVIDQAEQKIKGVEVSYEQAIAELQQDLKKYKNNNRRWQQLFYHWVKEKERLEEDNLALTEANARLQKDNTLLYAKQDSLTEQLNEKQDRIDELGRLHTRTQANLEHYRESIQQERAQDHERYQREKQDLQTEITTLKEELMMMREKSATIEKHCQAVENKFTALELTHTHLERQFTKQTRELEANQKEKNEHAKVSQHWQNQCKSLQQALADKGNELMEIKTEMKVLLQQLNFAKQSFAETAEQNKLLEKEKWKIAEERAKLEGKLQQLQIDV